MNPAIRLLKKGINTDLSGPREIAFLRDGLSQQILHPDSSRTLRLLTSLSASNLNIHRDCMRSTRVVHEIRH